MMSQFDANGRFIRSARYNATLHSIWAKQLPNARIEVI